MNGPYEAPLDLPPRPRKHRQVDDGARAGAAFRVGVRDRIWAYLYRGVRHGLDDGRPRRDRAGARYADSLRDRQWANASHPRSRSADARGLGGDAVWQARSVVRLLD